MKSAVTDGASVPNALADAYFSALQEYASQGNESALGQAYIFGRQAIARQKSLVELAALHHTALQKLMTEANAGDLERELVLTGSAFFAECLTPYEMAHRGFQDGIQALRQLNQLLEEEIKRIAYSVHDESGQLLVAVHLALADLARQLPQPQRDQISHIEGLLNEVEKQLRRFSHELRPTILDDLGWIPAIRFLADAVAKRSGLSIHVHSEVSGRLPVTVETALYRIVQEAINNAVKHAKARNLWIRAWQDSRVLICSVRDDGSGFDSAQLHNANQTKGMGLIAMRERLSALGGILNIASSPGEGTELSIRLPLEVHGGY